MSAGLAASTVTPGSTPPVVSLATPASALWEVWPYTSAGAAHDSAATIHTTIRRAVIGLLAGFDLRYGSRNLWFARRDASTPARVGKLRGLPPRGAPALGVASSA